MPNAKQNRKNAKSTLTRFIKYFNDITTVRDHTKINELKIRLSNAETLLHAFNSAQDEIEATDPSYDQNIDTVHLDERTKFENDYYNIISLAQKYISEFSDNSVNSSNNNSATEIKLPSLNLPNFDGSYDQWLFYRDTFLSIIHDNASLSNIQKFHYLRLSLKGAAAETIKSLQISADNYNIAWQLVTERFENKELLVTNHIKRIFNLPSLTKESNHGLRQLLDGLQTHLRALEVLQLPVHSWDAIIIYLMTTKLDQASNREWKLLKKSTDLPTLKEFISFLKERSRSLESLEPGEDSRYKSQNKTNFITHNKHSKSFLATQNANCSFCNGDHLIYACSDFLNLDPSARLKEVKRLRLCVNCLRLGHLTKDCRSSGCRKCNKVHHTLLHFQNSLQTNSRTNTLTQNQNLTSQDETQTNNQLNNINNELVLTSNNTYKKPLILLSTAIVKIFDNYNNEHECKVLLDSGSQSNFISEKLCKILNLPLNKIDFSVTGINQISSNINFRTTAKIHSKTNDFQISLSCLVLPNITGNLPNFSFDKNILNLPPNIVLADPNFHKSTSIDLLVGAEVFWELVSIGQIKLGNGQPILQKTKLGWILSGPISFKNSGDRKSIHCNISLDDNFLNDQLSKFWEIENICDTKFLSDEENACEAHFKQNTVCRADGHFSVSLPLKYSTEKLGDSKATATKRFLNLEQKLHKNPQLKAEYHRFMDEYLTLGHMSKSDNQNDTTGFFLPHHGVIKKSSSTTRLRVVFDGSAKTASGYSLNDILMVGPTIQNDLFSIILRFRKHNFVLSADITKMYRQVCVNSEHRFLQKILWRFNPNEDISVFNLNTVTYGTACAAFLAIRCLHEAAYIHQQDFPQISSIILHDFYVDDLLTGASTPEEILCIKRNLSKILEQHGFILRKWISNSRDIQTQEDFLLTIGHNEQNKTLGLLWNPSVDRLEYTISTNCPSDRITKRQILSSISQIFDPLGLLSPVTITAKVILQQLWKLKVSWDESIPMDLHTKWLSYRTQLNKLNDIKFPRHVICQNPVSIQLHGFCDAAETAYGACVFVKSINSDGNQTCNILCAKTRVSPLKQLTIPKLELCGAVLLANLTHKVTESMQIPFDKTFFWCDSTIVISWIKSSPSSLKPFVANRVAQIQNLTSANSWNYVSSSQNPADLLSRGIIPGKILNSRLWFHGPEWLTLSETDWPTSENSQLISLTDLPEVRKNITLVTINNDILDNINKFSSFLKLQRTFAWIIRFKNNIRKPHESRESGPLTTLELQESLNSLIRLVQYQAFSSEFPILAKSNQNYKGKLLGLNPFIDSENIIRVGGRIQNSGFDYNKKHPVILPNKCHFTTILARYEHIRLLHAGPQLLLASIRERFWPISGRNLVKKIVHDCVRCFRFNAKPEEYLMGNLPRERVSPSRPFLTCGLDYAGAFTLRVSKTRRCKTSKAYIALFVCMSTKAIHLEVVSDLTTECFLAALRRFFARRGKSAKLFSDNGTTFLGADREIKTFLQSYGDTVSDKLASEGISWSFIPARAPHFGGLWEAGVKSVKRHLYRVIGNTLLTFEEFCTVLCQIESCLNSRPLYPLSSDPNDTLPLTPAHFLIGEPLTTIPDNNWLDTPISHLSRFQKCQHIIQQFWDKWAKEYISHLQLRTKWKENCHTLLKPGVLVLSREDGLPPLKWRIGRVLQIHPGADNIVRAVTIKTSTGTYKRPVVKLCVLPQQQQ